MILRNSVSVIRRIPLFIRLTNRQKMTNLVTIPPNSLSQNTPRVGDETFLTYMGGYMFTLLAIMSWIHHRDVTYYSRNDTEYKSRIRHLEERIADLETKLCNR